MTNFQKNDLVIGPGIADSIYRITGFEDVFGIRCAILVRVRKSNLSDAITVRRNDKSYPVTMLSYVASKYPRPAIGHTNS